MIPVQRLLTVASVCSICFSSSHGVLNEGEGGGAPAASPQALQAISGFKVDPGFEISLWASEPQLGNPVAFCLDEKGSVYVAETYRFHHGVSDNRNSGYWVDEDLAAQSVEDRLAYYRKYANKFKEGFDWYSSGHDQIRILKDTDGDGRADFSRVFSGPYQDPLDGLGSGVIARDGYIYYTNIPHLWRLRDGDGDGVAEEKEALLSGFGVRTAFLGHDMHGMVWGPDGKLYWSIGDRGFNVTSREGKTLKTPNRGAAFRCNPDGTEFEIFYHGLRNPQELAFDKFGNLFTCDNNSDSGDKARIVYLIEGGDTGWSMEFQYMEGDYSRGPYNAEGIWHEWTPENELTRPACYLPPVDNEMFSGPSGFVYMPGNLFGEEFRDSFFITDFRGNPANSHVLNFHLKPSGAGFELEKHHRFLSNVLLTDIDFGYDGKLYGSDWITGWGGTGNGRIYTVTPKTISDEQRATIQKAGQQMAQGFSSLSVSQALDLLTLDDMRVRLRAQYRLAEFGAEALPALRNALQPDQPQLTRIHALWALGQIQGQHKGIAPLPSLLSLLEDADPQMRTQMARLCGNYRIGESAPMLHKLLTSGTPANQADAAIALGKLGTKDVVPTLIRRLEENGTQDIFLRHALVMGLVGCASQDELIGLKSHPASAVRLAAVIALRRLQDPQVQVFLKDANTQVVTEAARAIYDLGLASAYPALADVLPQGAQHFSQMVGNKSVPNRALIRRVLNVHNHLGKYQPLLDFLANAQQDDPMRAFAASLLEHWASPSARDAVDGHWRPIATRSVDELRLAFQKHEASIFNANGGLPARDVLDMAASLGLGPQGAGVVAEWVRDTAWKPDIRARALRLLAQANDPSIVELMNLSLAGSAPEALRAEALRLLPSLGPDRAIDLGKRILTSGQPMEKQAAVEMLSRLKRPEADDVLLAELRKLQQGGGSPGILLELMEWSKSGNAQVQEEWTNYTRTGDASDSLHDFRYALAGGEVEAGKKVFTAHAAAQCTRCHIDGGGIGPDLRGIGSRKDSAYLLRSVIAPNEEIADGFGMTSVTLKGGQVVAGVQKENSPEHLVIQDPDGKLHRVAKSDVAEQTPAVSAMPPVALLITPRELRDVVAYLQSRK